MNRVLEACLPADRFDSVLGARWQGESGTQRAVDSARPLCRVMGR